MSKFLMIDVGAGTMDILHYDTETDLHYKAVVKSPVREVAERAGRVAGNLLVVGNEMGGGPITQALTARANEAEVVMSVSAAATLNHDLDKVRSWGIKVVEDERAEDLRRSQSYTAISLGDLEPERLEQIVKGFGVPFEFDAVAICAQDHGVPPPGISHLDFRHNLFKARLEADPHPHTLLYSAVEVPNTMNRLKSIAQSALKLQAAEIYVMDSGMAAILGASMDSLAQGKNAVLLLDIATSHTVGAAMAGEEIAGFFEYHTQDITLEKLETLLHDLAEGKLSHRQILAEGGHGAFLRRAVGFNAIETIIATGPKRKLVARSHLPIQFGAPWGDNMMTGTVGLLEAMRRCQGLGPITYL
jgi:uncharacterized protein (DUF1786 family)